MKSDLKLELAKELALEASCSAPDIGIRAGLNSLRPLFRGRVVTSFASWNFLELHEHRELKTAAIHAIEQHGVGLAAGRHVGGTTAAHTACEVRMARFFAAEGALLFSTKNQAVLSTITALCSEGVVVLGPSLSVLPLADASALMGSEYAEFESAEQLPQLLERYRLAKRTIVVAEALSPLTGERLNASGFFAALEQFGAWGIVDETAALGHTGLRGAGSADELPSSPALLGRLVGLGSICGVELAALVGSQELCNLLAVRSRYARFERAPALVSTVVGERALDLVEVAISQRERLLQRSRLVQGGLRAQGWRVTSDDSVPVTSIWCESLSKARELQDALLQRGCVVDALAARGVRRNGAVVRMLLSTGHTEEGISGLMDGLLEIRKRLSVAG